MNEELTKPEIFHTNFKLPDLNKWLFEFKDEMATSFLPSFIIPGCTHLPGIYCVAANGGCSG